ncbi:MAG TPA: hypothetical protein VFJ85_08540 [Acidimicrobiales bacterium]|nr:hypothetical protein [Acidimicrobiales bacterium]
MRADDAGPALRYELIGARGGQGTTTVATTLALLAAAHRPVALAARRPEDVAALTAAPSGPLPVAVGPNLALVDDVAGHGEVAVRDLGHLGELEPGELAGPQPGTRRWLVVRGPCFVSLQRAIEQPWRPDGVVLLAEPGRALDATDVTAVLDVPVVATVAVDPAVARSIDAGLLPVHVGRLGPLRQLGRLLATDLAKAGLLGPGQVAGRPLDPAAAVAFLAAHPSLGARVEAEGRRLADARNQRPVPAPSPPHRPGPRRRRRR